MSCYRGKQIEYNKLLDKFGGRKRSFTELQNHLIDLGFSLGQAKNAVHVFLKGGYTTSHFRLSREIRNKLLDDFNAERKLPKECVEYMMNIGCTYRQATSAVYKYRQERGLIGT